MGLQLHCQAHGSLEPWCKCCMERLQNSPEHASLLRTLAGHPALCNSKPVQVTRLTARPFLWSSSPPAGMMIVRDVKVDIRLSKDIEVGLDLSNTNSARAIHTYCKLPLTFKIKMSDFESQRRYIYVYLCFIKVPVCLGTHPPPAWCF